MFKNVRRKVFKPASLGFTSIALAVLVFTAFAPAPGNYHSFAGKVAYRSALLTEEVGVYLTGSGNCVQCHGTDVNGASMVDENGNDASMVWDWQATMMANSAKDPFWKAKVRHEILETPSIAGEIENTCTSCHAPQGHFEHGMANEDAHYTMEILAEDALGLDGVGCMACHGIEDENLANTNNGNIPYTTNHIAYGTFEDPWSSPMIQQTGIAPVFGEHMGKSEVCAGCHSLFVPSVNPDGSANGVTFFEQATYHEWLNSDFDENNIECQSCHMPEIPGGASVASSPTWLFPRPFKKHFFVGGNSFMVKLMRDNAEQLGLSASEEQFDLVAERSDYLLQNESLVLFNYYLETNNDSADFEVVLNNLAGHKFPSGYPSRLLTVEATLTDADGNLLFQSGGFDEDFDIVGRDPGYEPHYDIIRSEDEVQIYEMVFANAAGELSTVLEHAHTLIKDNRLPPQGFTTTHEVYDTTRIGGLAQSDPDFNIENGEEGSGKDRIRYRIKMNGYTGDAQFNVKVWYQSVPPRWVEDMFTWDDPEINAFREMFEAAEPEPVLVAESNLDVVVGTSEHRRFEPRIYPNPTQNAFVRVDGELPTDVRYAVYDLTGRMRTDFRTLSERRVELPEEAGTYLVLFQSGDEVFSTRRIVKL